MTRDATVWFLTTGVGKVIDHAAIVGEIGVHRASVHTFIMATESISAGASEVTAIFPSLSSRIFYSLVNAFTRGANNLSLVGLWRNRVGLRIVRINRSTVWDSAAGGISGIGDVITSRLSIQDFWTSAQTSVDSFFCIFTCALVAAAIIPRLALLVLLAIVHTEISLHTGCGSLSLNLRVVRDEFTLGDLTARVVWILCKPAVRLGHVVKGAAFVNAFVVTSGSIITDAVIVTAILPCLPSIITLILVHTVSLFDIGWGCWCHRLMSSGIQNDPGPVRINCGVQGGHGGLNYSHSRCGLSIRGHRYRDLSS